MTFNAQNLGLLLVLLLTTAVYSPVGDFAFVNYDDGDYVYANPRVNQGLTIEGVQWALTARHSANWHPLTWISHMGDVSVYGLRAGGHHLTSLIWHLLNTAMLFAALRSMTGQPAHCLAVAALFAIHPLHVQSVAWVAERKDLLSAFFGFAAMAVYGRYARDPGLGRYLAVAGLMAASLASKAMLVTLPMVLLLLDYWPLGRWRPGNRGRLILEKLPLLGLAAIGAALVVAAQRQEGAVAQLGHLPMDARFANAAVAYVTYLAKFFWPVNLSVFYAHPGRYPLWQPLAAGLVLAVVTVAVLRSRRPSWTVGWLWFLGTLVPVIGLVQVGLQSMADRYSYIPLVGWTILVVWALAEAGQGLRVSRPAAIGAIGSVLVFFTALTSYQVGFWADSQTLYRRALAVAGPHPIVHYNLGNHLLDQGRYDQAVDQYENAIAIAPEAHTYNNQGLAYFRMAEPQKALASYQKALELEPGHGPTHNNVANLLWSMGQTAGALNHWQRAVALEPGNAVFHDNHGFGLMHRGDVDAALIAFEQALRLDPNLASARGHLLQATALKRQQTGP